MIGAQIASISSSNEKKIPKERKRHIIIEEEVKEVAPRGAESFTTTMIKGEKLGRNKSGVNLFNLGDIVEVIEEEEDSDEDQDYRNKKQKY